MSQDDRRAQAARLDRLEARLTRLASDLEDVAGITDDIADDIDVVSDAGDGTGGDPVVGDRFGAGTGVSGVGDGGAVPGSRTVVPVFSSSEEWVELYLLTVFQRFFGGDLRWCSRWAEHPEARVRLEAMWRAWEVLHADPGLGLSVWLLSHFDPGFAALTARHGPFAACTVDRHA